MGFIENWKSGESAIGKWLAETVTGTIVKTATAPAVLWVGTEAGNWNLPGWALVAIVGVVPTIVNLLNPADARMGIKGKDATLIVEEKPEE